MQDTVLNPVAKLSDSLRAILDPISTHITDSLRAALRSVSVHVTDTLQVASQPEGWSTANWIALAAVIVSAFFSALVLRLQGRQNKLEEKIHAEQTKATDQRIGWTAFKLMKQLQSWLDEPISGTGKNPSTLIQGMQSSATNAVTLGPLAQWATERCHVNQSADAEARAEVLVDSAPNANEQVGSLAVKAFWIFQQAIGDLNKGLMCMREQQFDTARDYFIHGHKTLGVCIQRLEELIPDALQGDLMFLNDALYTVHGHAPTVPVKPHKTLANNSEPWWRRCFGKQRGT